MNEQRKDANLQNIHQNIHRYEKYYTDYDEVLFKRSEDRRFEDQVAAPRSLVPRVIHTYHDLPLAGHMGIDKTYDRVKKRFHWTNMLADVRKYVNACVSCAQMNTSQHTRPTPLQKFKIPPRPFHRITLDVVGALPKTGRGNRFILFHALTKYVETFPPKHLSPETFLIESH